jgi:cytochrome c553
MKRRILRITLWSLAVIVTLLLAAAGFVWARSSSRLGHTFEVPSPELPADHAPSLENGARLAAVASCGECHGEDLGGGPFIEAPPFAVLPAANLTRGRGGVGGRYDAAGWARAIRQGVAADGRGLLVMPVHTYEHLSNEDVLDLAAWLASRPPVDRESGARALGPIGRVALALDDGELMPALAVDHAAVGTAPRPLDPVEWGHYLTRTCTACHGASMAGGPVAFAAAGDPPAANLTPHADGLAGWSHEDLDRAMRQGRRPDGRVLDELMPWKSYSALSDEQMDAIWAYLQSLEPAPSAWRRVAATDAMRDAAALGCRTDFPHGALPGRRNTACSPFGRTVSIIQDAHTRKETRPWQTPS